MCLRIENYFWLAERSGLSVDKMAGSFLFLFMKITSPVKLQVEMAICSGGCNKPRSTKSSESWKTWPLLTIPVGFLSIHPKWRFMHRKFFIRIGVLNDIMEPYKV